MGLGVGSTAVDGRRRAVTLIELLLVISLITLLALFTWPNFDNASRRERLDESARRLKSLIAMCRAEAMNEAVRYRVTFRLDGSVKVRRQYDPIKAPHVYIPVGKSWARMAFLLEDVWVESVALLPDGPPPILVDDELEEFDDMEEDLEPILIEEFETPIEIDFAVDGTSDSLLWILRDSAGRGKEMTLDGRLGRVSVELIDPCGCRFGRADRRKSTGRRRRTTSSGCGTRSDGSHTSHDAEARQASSSGGAAAGGGRGADDHGGGAGHAGRAARQRAEDD